MPGNPKQASDHDITRRGFVILAASALGSLFLRPSPPAEEGYSYLVSVRSIGYGYGWDDWEAGAGIVPEPPTEERAREALHKGSILEFMHDPSAPEEDPWLLALSDDKPVCELPFCAVPEEIAVTQRIYDAMREGGVVRARVTSASHLTLSDYGRSERIHEIEFDVFVVT